MVLAANHILLQFVHISSYALDGFAFSAEALVGAGYGKKSKRIMRDAAIKTTLWAFICATLITLFLFNFSEKLIRLMVTDEGIQNVTIKYSFWMVITPLSGFLSFMLDGIFIGATKTQYMRKAMFQSCIVYIISMLIFFPFFENYGLWICINVFFLSRAISLLRYYPALENFKK